MEKYIAGKYDIAIIGGGHAGCEAALAAARMGSNVIMLSINLESIGMMPCNPSIGGTGKGHLVHEIDALGGQMGITADQACIQSKMLNTSKGPAVHSLRMQEDKLLYQSLMKQTLESEKNIYLKQAEVIDILVDSVDGKNKVKGVEIASGAQYLCKRVVIATGTYLDSTVYMGDSVMKSGPNGMRAANELSKNLTKIGLELRRFKTGTPPRIHARSVDFNEVSLYGGDNPAKSFSFLHSDLDIDEIPSYLCYTNEQTHNVINKNMHKSAYHVGHMTTNLGPRYCPSIEDKVVRFADRERHQIFIEPEGRNTSELYIQGLSTSMPENIQYEMLATIPALKNAQITRSAYTIEYDCINSTTLKLSLESKAVDGLFCAGQFNGSSGYEEAAAQGIVAGINAHRSINGIEPIIIDRSQGYIGVMIDDMVTKGTAEPYRIMTGRCEYRLVLRQDNADSRLTQIGRDIGLVDDNRYELFLKKQEDIQKEIERIKNTKLQAEDLNKIFSKFSMKPTSHNMYIYELLKRPEINYEILEDLDIERPSVSADIVYEIEVQMKYGGYIEKQLQQIKKFKKLEKRLMPENIDYLQINGLRNEAKQKLAENRPISIGQASRIQGVSPADISVLLIYLETINRKK